MIPHTPTLPLITALRYNRERCGGLGVDFELAKYIDRIGYEGELRPTLAVLSELTRAHTIAIAFENIDVVLGRGVSLAAPAIFEKLVLRKRGGYCFEQNALLHTALAAIGFNATLTSGRVRLRFSERETIAPRTHVFIHVRIDAEDFITDVGMGSGSLTCALPLAPLLTEHSTAHDFRRIEQAHGTFYHQLRYRSEDPWIDACEFTLEAMPLIDREIANWYTSAHPQSHFRDRLVAARALPDGGRLSLENFDFTRRSGSGAALKVKLASVSELLNVLEQEFHIVLSDDERHQIQTNQLSFSLA